MKKIILLFCTSLLVFGLDAQITGDYRSNGTPVDFSSATNWQSYSGSAWVTASSSPAAAGFSSGNTITIKNGHTWNNSASFTVASGVTVMFQGSVGSFSAGAITLNGTYVHFSTGAASTVYTGMTINTNSTFIYRASSTVQPTATLNGRTYYNLTFDTDGSTSTNPTFSSPGISSPLVINGNLTVNTWNIDMYSSSNTGATTFNGDIILTSNTNSYLGLKPTTIASGHTLTIGATDSLFITASILTVNGTLLNQSTKTIGFKTSATMVVNSGGTFQLDVNGSSIPNSTATYNSGSTINVTGITSISTLPVLPTSCGNVIWNCPSQTNSNTFINTTSNSTTVTGNLTVTSTGTGAIYLGGATTARTLMVTGNITVNGGNLAVIKPSTGGTANQTCSVTGDLIISSGSLYIADAVSGAYNYTGKGYLNIGGNLTHTGGTFGAGSTAYANTGYLYFNTNNTGNTISTTGLSGKINIVADKTSTGVISLATALSIPDSSSLTVNTGTFKLNGFTTTLSSSAATSSARVYVVSGASIDQSVSGSKFTVNQYIPGGTRAYRFLAHPFNTSINLSELTDDIDITGNDGNSNVAGTGFTSTSTNNPSAFWYDPTTGNGATSAGWTAFTRNDGINAAVGSTSNTWNTAQGIRVLIRGTKGQSNIFTSSPPSPNAVTINMSGKINDGNDVAVTLTKGTNSGFNLISNPYCAPIDMYQFRTANSNANATAGSNFYVWLPTGGVNGRGQYITGDMTSSGETYRYLPAYSSFFVSVSSTTTATFKEAHKAASTQASAYTLGVSGTSIYGANTMQVQLSRNNLFEDRVLLFFNDDKTKGIYDDKDALKLPNSDLNFYTLSEDNQQLAIDRRPVDKAKETIIPLVFTTSLAAAYSIDVKDLDLSNGATIYLRDKLVNTETKLLKDVSYSFNSDVNTSSSNNRFELVIKPMFTALNTSLETSFAVTLSPNPVSDILKISFTNKEKANTNIQLINIEGKAVNTVNAGTVQSGQVNINVKPFAKGTYYVLLDNGTDKKTEKVIIQ